MAKYQKNRRWRVVFGCVWWTMALVCGGLFGVVGYYRQVLPDRYTVTQGQMVQVGPWIEGHLADSRGAVIRTATTSEGGSYRTRLCLGGILPIKDVTVTATQQTVVMVCGIPFGIKLYTKGVLVVGLSDVSTAAGKVNPAAAAGVCVGDTILAIDGKAVHTSNEVGSRIRDCGGKQITLRLERDGVEFDASFTPIRPADETEYRAGMWVRDSAAGVGTLTFYDPVEGTFAGLGHAVCDVDTGEQMTLSEGEIVPARIFGVTKGRAGKPGELKGCFDTGSWGVLMKNGENGLYGSLTSYPIGWQTMAVARRQQVEEGAAQILCTIDGTHPQAYDVVIEQVRYGGIAATRNMTIRVTDPALLSATGGIVQGM